MTRHAQILFWFTLAAIVALLGGCVGMKRETSNLEPLNIEPSNRATTPAQGSKFKVQSSTVLSDPARQQRQMNAPDAARWPMVQSRAMTLALVPVATKIIHIQADPVVADGYNLYGGTKLDRSDWSFRATSPLPDFAVLGDKPFEWFGIRAYFRNGPDGAQTEGGWAAR